MRNKTIFPPIPWLCVNKITIWTICKTNFCELVLGFLAYLHEIGVKLQHPNLNNYEKHVEISKQNGCHMPMYSSGTEIGLVQQP